MEFDGVLIELRDAEGEGELPAVAAEGHAGRRRYHG
jgi:hypothetical protein